MIETVLYYLPEAIIMFGLVCLLYLIAKPRPEVQSPWKEAK